MTFRLRQEVETDIEATALYIAKYDPAAALRGLDGIHQRCETLGDMPGLGVAKPMSGTTCVCFRWATT